MPYERKHLLFLLGPLDLLLVDKLKVAERELGAKTLETCFPTSSRNAPGEPMIVRGRNLCLVLSTFLKT